MNTNNRPVLKRFGIISINGAVENEAPPGTTLAISVNKNITLEQVADHNQAPTNLVRVTVELSGSGDKDGENAIRYVAFTAKYIGLYELEQNPDSIPQALTADEDMQLFMVAQMMPLATGHFRNHLAMLGLNNVTLPFSLL